MGEGACKHLARLLGVLKRGDKPIRGLQFGSKLTRKDALLVKKVQASKDVGLMMKSDELGSRRTPIDSSRESLATRESIDRPEVCAGG